MFVKKRRMRSPLVGRVGKSVEVREIVAGVETRGTAALFERAEAGEIEFPFSSVGGEELREKFFGASGRILEDDSKWRGFFLFGFCETGDAVFDGTIGDVFVKSGTGLCAAEEKIAVVLGNDERSIR